MKQKEKHKAVQIILDRLKKMYPDAQCELNYGSTFQLLVAVVLSAQTTDKKVNEITSQLFLEYPDLESMLQLTEEELQEKIRKIGLYRNKAKNIHRLCVMLKDKYNGEVPNTFETLIQLPGVGRKTANVVLSNAFSIPAIAVDTHVFRVSNRIGLAHAENVLETEKQLMRLIPKTRWSEAHHLLIWHGRRVCKAQRPECEKCAVNDLCKYYTG